jgi:hypothetical protein
MESYVIWYVESDTCRQILNGKLQNLHISCFYILFQLLHPPMTAPTS